MDWRRQRRKRRTWIDGCERGGLGKTEDRNITVYLSELRDRLTLAGETEDVLLQGSQLFVACLLNVLLR